MMALQKVRSAMPGRDKILFCQPISFCEVIER